MILGLPGIFSARASWQRAGNAHGTGHRHRRKCRIWLAGLTRACSRQAEGAGSTGLRVPERAVTNAASPEGPQLRRISLA
jgi:hypothetical protein